MFTLSSNQIERSALVSQGMADHGTIFRSLSDSHRIFLMVE